MITMLLSMFLSFLSLSPSARANSVVDLDIPLSNTIVTKTITRAIIQEFDVIRMDMSVYESRDLHFQLICSFNTFYDYEESHLILTHYSPFRGLKFKLGESDCLKVFNFMKKRFEYINDETPLEVVLDYKKMEVQKIRWKTDLYPEESFDLS